MRGGSPPRSTTSTIWGGLLDSVNTTLPLSHIQVVLARMNTIYRFYPTPTDRPCRISSRSKVRSRGVNLVLFSRYPHMT